MDMQTDWTENHAVLRGEVVQRPEPSHESHGIAYDRFPLSVRRLSGHADVVNVIAPRPLLAGQRLLPGGQVEVTGEVRSFNNKSGTGRRLVISLLARGIRPDGGPHSNTLTLRGSLCKPPILRTTPLGREICDLMLAVSRRYGRADYLPCIAWGASARRCAGLEVGDGLWLEGRFQSRAYTKVIDGESQERVAYEISAVRLEPEPARQARPLQSTL